MAHPARSVTLLTCPDCGKPEHQWWDCDPATCSAVYKDLVSVEWVALESDQKQASGD